MRFCGEAVAGLRLFDSGSHHDTVLRPACGLLRGLLNGVIVLSYQSVAAGAQSVDSILPNQYGPRGFEGRFPIRRAREWRKIMPDDAHDETGDQSGNEAALSARLRRLGDELGRDRPGRMPQREGPPPQSVGSGMARGLRLSTELVAGVLVGAGIGWALDRWLGISPWGLIVFLLLGFAAGVLNVVRAAGVPPGDTQ
jgi:ATP synthase protein I